MAFRTTVSISEDLHPRLDQVVKSQNLSVLDGIREAIKQYVEGFEVGCGIGNGRAAHGIRQIAEVSRTFKNPYQDILANWRVSRTLRQLDAVASYRLDLEAWPAEIYLMKVLTEVMRRLDSRDEYLTITNLRFWRDTMLAGRTGSDCTYEHFYLKAQEEAVSLGMRLHRIFLICADELESDAYILVPHKCFLERMAKKYPGQVKVEFVRCSNLNDWLLRFGHFACVRRRDQLNSKNTSNRDCGCLVVEPMYDATARMTSLRFLCSRGSGDEDSETNFYIDRFGQAASISQTLRDLPLPCKASTETSASESIAMIEH